MASLLEVRNLTVAYSARDQWTQVVRDVTFEIRKGETLGLVGESGSGKSTVAYRLLGYRSPNSRIEAGSVIFDGHDLLSLDPGKLRMLRGNRIAIVPQNPTAALSPAMRIHAQLSEMIGAHGSLPPNMAMDARIAELLRLVGLSNGSDLSRRYPYELSGGQQQRVAIAMAVSCNPDLLVLDEPTTGLDVTTQRQIVELLGSLRDRVGMSMLYVTHDLALLAQIADRIGVMYAGELVEIGPSADLLSQPTHVYTRKLISAIPNLDIDPAKDASAEDQPLGSGPGPLLTLDHVNLGYRSVGKFKGLFGIKPPVTAIDINFDVGRGEILALVGESGSGKSTIARAIGGQLAPQSGEIRFDGESLEPTVKQRSRQKLQAIQYIFQNPDSSLNPRRRIRDILLRPLRHFDLAVNDGILQEMLAKVRLRPGYLKRFPRQLSGGESQRIAIARALIVNPRLIICDEILSALDVSVQASVLDILKSLRSREAVSMLFISHDLAVVRQLADRIVVLYAGRVMQTGSVQEIFEGPRHPYTEMLLAAAPRLAKDRYVAPAPKLPENPADIYAGCPLIGRCPNQMGDLCRGVIPPRQSTPTGYLHCHIPVTELWPPTTVHEIPRVCEPAASGAV